MRHWQSKRDGREYFAGGAVLDLGRAIVQRGLARQQRTLIHVATNSIHFYFAPADGPGSASSLQQLQCDDCSAVLTLEHLALCQSQ